MTIEEINMLADAIVLRLQGQAQTTISVNKELGLTIEQRKQLSKERLKLARQQK